MPTGVYQRTEKHMAINKGRKYPNRKSYKKGWTDIPKVCLFCNKGFITNCIMPNKKYCSTSCRGKANVHISMQSLSKIDREKQRQVVSSRKGELHPNWKGGNSLGYKTGYYSLEYKNWRKSVFERDNYTCQECRIKNVYITAHHIKSFAHYPELRFEIDNGLTLCEECHKKTDNYKGRNKGKGKLTKL